MIRNACKSDIKQLLKLFKYGYNFHFINRPDKFEEKNDEYFIKQINDYIDNNGLITIEIDNKIVGYLAYELITKVNKFLWIDELVIGEDYQNHGYATDLLNKIKEIAQENKCKRIELGCWSFNEKAIKIYKKMKYSEQKIIFELNIF